jgi:hypothetical protein
MDTMALRVFQREVARQCRFALTAAQQLNEALRRRDMELAWFDLQNLLIAIAQVSRLLFPAKPERNRLPERGKELRQSLGVPDDSPLSEAALSDLRNDFEHFDDRVEQWVTESSRRNLVDDFIGPRSAIGGIDPNDFMRSFDPQTSTAEFWHHSLDLQRVVAAIEELLPKAQIEAAKPHW